MNRANSIQINIAELTKIVENDLKINTLFFEKLSLILNLKPGIINTILSPVKSRVDILLRIIAGLDKDFSGKAEVSAEGEKTSSVKVVYIPSKPSSFPWMSVAENISLGFESRELSAGEQSGELKSLLSLTGLEGYESHFADNNSLGFRFRISLARALAVKPDLIILDNPFSLMDPKIKDGIFKTLKKAAGSSQTVLLFSTNIVNEALSASDEIDILGEDSAGIISRVSVAGVPADEKIKKIIDAYAVLKCEGLVLV